MESHVCALCTRVCVGATQWQSSYAAESARAAGWVDGPRLRPHNSLIMPLQGDSQLLMAFWPGRERLRRRVVLFRQCCVSACVRCGTRDYRYRDAKKAISLQNTSSSERYKYAHLKKVGAFNTAADKWPGYQTLFWLEGRVGLSAVKKNNKKKKDQSKLKTKANGKSKKNKKTSK